MPLNTPIETLELNGWTGGLNREADPFLLEPTESPDALNVDFGLRGEVSKRKGYTKFTSIDSTATKGTALNYWSRLGGGDFFVYVDDAGNMWYADAATLVASGAAFGTPSTALDYPMAFASLNNQLFVTTLRGTAQPYKFDGTTWTAITTSALAGGGSDFPKAAVTVTAHERIFAFNIKNAAGTQFRSRMHYSNPLLPETWEALDYIDFAPDNGQEITAAALFGEQIIVFKNHSMFALSGTDENSFSVYPIDTAVGTECPGTVVTAGPELFFFDHLSGVWSFDGTSYKKIDDKINAYLLDGVNEEYAHVSTAFVYRGRYYLSVPWGADQVPSRTFVYDGRISAWTEYTFGFGAAAIKDAKMYTVAPSSKVGIFKMWEVDNDAGDAIAAKLATTWLAPGEPSFKYRLRRLDLAFAAAGNFDITADMRRDFVLDPFVTQSINTSPGGALWDSVLWGADEFGSGVSQVLVRTTGWGTNEAVRWRVCQFEFSESTVNPFQINRMVLQVSRIGRLRGEP